MQFLKVTPEKEVESPHLTGTWRGSLAFLYLDFISGIKYVHLQVGILRKIFRSLEIRVYPYNERKQGIDNTASK